MITTRISSATAKNILRMDSRARSAPCASTLSTLVTPSTRKATSSPKSLRIVLRVKGARSAASCKSPAATEAVPRFSFRSWSETATGWSKKGSPESRRSPSWIFWAKLNTRSRKFISGGLSPETARCWAYSCQVIFIIYSWEVVLAIWFMYLALKSQDLEEHLSSPFFTTTSGEERSGHSSPLGRCQEAKSHLGYREQP